MGNFKRQRAIMRDIVTGEIFLDQTRNSIKEMAEYLTSVFPSLPAEYNVPITILNNWYSNAKTKREEYRHFLWIGNPTSQFFFTNKVDQSVNNLQITPNRRSDAPGFREWLASSEENRKLHSDMVEAVQTGNFQTGPRDQHRFNVVLLM